MDLAAKNGWGRGRRCWVAGALLPRRRSPGESPPGVPVAGSGRGVALEHARGTRDPLEVVARASSDRCRGFGRRGSAAAVGSPEWAELVRPGSN